MKCPFCGGEMKRGTLKFESRTPAKWQSADEKAGLFGSGKPIRSFRRSFPMVEADGERCERCGKAVIDVKL